MTEEKTRLISSLLPVAVIEALIRAQPGVDTDANDLVVARGTLTKELAVHGYAPETIRPGHPRWEEFADRLEGPEGCNFRKDDKDKITWDCGGGMDKSKSEAILRDMLPAEEELVARSLAYFTASGGHCDCEVLMNVAAH